MPDIQTVAVIGAGTMGRSIAYLILRKSLSVRLVDTDASALVNAGLLIQDDLSAEVSDRIEAENPIAKLKTFTGLSEGVASADLVFEAVPENMALKKEIFRAIDRLCPPAVILASNTSGLPITGIAAAAANHPRRVIGTHFYTPAHVIPLVEVIKSDYTGSEVTWKVMSFLQALGKDPVLINRDTS